MLTKLDSTLDGLTLPNLISNSNSSSIDCFAFSESSDFIPKHIEYSEDAWVIIIMLISFFEIAKKSLLENPGTPIIPFPSKVTSDTLSI